MADSDIFTRPCYLSSVICHLSSGLCPLSSVICHPVSDESDRDRESESGQKVGLIDFDETNLMDGDVTVRVEWSTLNYKDGLAITGKAPVVRRFPMIPGSISPERWNPPSHPDWKPGDKVILNGWGCGETHLGGYGEKARVKGDWLVRLPATMSAREAMAIGTAGYTAMLAVIAIERHGLTPAKRPGGGHGCRRRCRVCRNCNSFQAWFSGHGLHWPARSGRLPQKTRRQTKSSGAPISPDPLNHWQKSAGPAA